MSDLVPVTQNALATVGNVITDGVRYGVVLGHLISVGHAMRQLSELTSHTFDYVEDCAASVDRLAETAASMNVDRDTVGEHHQAAQIMRGGLDKARALSARCADMSVLFELASAAHEADYGSVAAAAQSMPVDQAESRFYSNR